MAERIKITPAELQAQANEMKSLEGAFSTLFSGVSSDLKKVNTNWSSNLSHNFEGKINSAQRSFTQITQELMNGAKVADTCAVTFESVDSQLAIIYGGGVGGSNGTRGGMPQSVIDAVLSGAPVAEATANMTEEEKSWFAKFLNNELKVSDAVLSGEKSGSGSFLGFNTAGTAKGDLLYGEAGFKSKASWGFDKETGKWNFDDFGFGTEAYAAGTVAQGEISGNIGYLHGKAGGKFVTGGVSAEAKATLWDDGKFNPSLMVGAKAEATLLQGEAEVGFGNDQYGVYAKADGDLLHAEAEAGAGIGYIGKDKNGNAMYGAKAEASAMACVAQGKVAGGFTIFGIDIDVGLKGYAAAAGVEVGGAITTTGAKVDLGGALGLGAGMDISIDWSDAKWIGETADAVGDFVGDGIEIAKDIGDAAIDFGTDVAKAAVDFGSDVAKAAQDFGGDVLEAAGDVGDYLFGWLK